MSVFVVSHFLALAWYVYVKGELDTSSYFSSIDVTSPYFVLKFTWKGESADEVFYFD